MLGGRHCGSFVTAVLPIAVFVEAVLADSSVCGGDEGVEAYEFFSFALFRFGHEYRGTLKLCELFAIFLEVVVVTVETLDDVRSKGFALAFSVRIEASAAICASGGSTASSVVFGPLSVAAVDCHVGMLLFVLDTLGSGAVFVRLKFSDS